MAMLHDILGPIFDPIPLIAMIIVVFALAAFLVISKFFKMPSDFPIKEQIRDELRFRITSERRANLSEDDVNAPLDTSDKPAGEAKETDKNKTGKTDQKEAETAEKA